VKKKILTLAISFILSSAIYAQDINIQNGWQLLGATEDINVSKFDNSCVDYVWKYDTTNISNPQWQVHIANEQTYNYTGSTIAYLNIGDGFWIKGNSDCNISTNNNSNTIINLDGTIIFNGKTYDTVTSETTGRIWLDRNLGASQICTALDDQNCFGNYYQWGRLSDGHELINSIGIDIKIINLNLINQNFIYTSGDWTTEDQNGSIRALKWLSVNGDGICPTGYMVPTIEEIEAETIDANLTNKNDLFNSILKLPASGYRVTYSDNYFQDEGFIGYFWSSTYDTYPQFIKISSEAKYTYTSGTEATRGFPIRCIKDN